MRAVVILLKNKRGISYVKTAVWILVLCMLLSLILSYASMMTVIQMTKDNTERVLDSYVTHNSILIYDSIKNGTDFTESLNNFYYKAALSDELSLDLVGNSLYNKDGQGGTIYQVINPSVTFELDNTLKLRAAYDILIPVEFAGKHITNLRIPQVVTSFYNLK